MRTIEEVNEMNEVQVVAAIGVISPILISGNGTQELITERDLLEKRWIQIRIERGENPTVA